MDLSSVPRIPRCLWFGCLLSNPQTQLTSMSPAASHPSFYSYHHHSSFRLHDLLSGLSEGPPIHTLGPCLPHPIATTPYRHHFPCSIIGIDPMSLAPCYEALKTPYSLGSEIPSPGLTFLVFLIQHFFNHTSAR